METTISLLLPHHPSSLKHNHTYHLLLPLPTPLFPSKLSAIRSRDLEFSGLNFGDDVTEKRRKKNGRKWWREKRQRQRAWWDFEDDENDRLRGDYKAGSFQQVVGSIWIFKVLRSYGWFLPFILLSLLLSTGPKAFLTAFSIALGLSLVILAFQKLQEWLNESLKPRRRRGTRSPFSLENVFLMEEDDDFEEEIMPKRRNRRRDYRSWEADNNEDSTTRTNNFGGWDDLVITEKETRHGRRNPKMSAPKVPVEEKLNKSEEERDLPLLLRLLIGLFPFLGSWTELF